MDGAMGDADVYEEVRCDLMRYAVALTGPSDAEDVVSSVVTRVLARPGGLSGLREPRPYLMRAVLNEVRARYRANQRGGRSGSSTPAMAGDGHADGVEDLVAAVIASLPPRQRAAAFLVFYEEHTPAEAAEVMDCRPGTVRRYLHMARKTLAEALDG
jgi:RNA polymerase sigma-70 factor, ECF subfamily